MDNLNLDAISLPVLEECSFAAQPRLTGLHVMLARSPCITALDLYHASSLTANDMSESHRKLMPAIEETQCVQMCSL